MANEQRLIDANDLKQKAVPHYFDNCCYAVSVKDIDDAPTVDAVEVVRCKDCKYYEIGKDYLPYCNHCDGGIADYPRKDDFCSYGERKDNET